MANRARVRLLIAIVAALSALVALVWGLNKSRTERVAVVTSVPAEDSHALSSIPTPATPSPSPSTQPGVEATPQPTPTMQPSPVAPATSHSLLIPVAGVRADELRDTFAEARSEGRIHDAIDIPAPRGTPVLAAADGRIVKLFESERGGTTIYQLDPDNKTIYYYAHLERYADGLTEGHTARRGEVIAYVGDTGNAGAGNYHLHFSILIIKDPKRYWDGTNINPYPLLRGSQ
jgi:murein DD-endopeptidase MepM/ murein hydrolase activator NlpD